MAYKTTNNPIYSIDGVPGAVPPPSEFIYKVQDVSQSGSGRTQDGKMWKGRIGQCVRIDLKWQNVTTAVATDILRAFNPEYINVNYIDLLCGGFVTENFYVGDRNNPMYNQAMGLWSEISFAIIMTNAMTYNTSTHQWE